MRIIVIARMNFPPGVVRCPGELWEGEQREPQGVKVRRLERLQPGLRVCAVRELGGCVRPAQRGAAVHAPGPLQQRRLLRLPPRLPGRLHPPRPHPDYQVGYIHPTPTQATR